MAKGWSVLLAALGAAVAGSVGADPAPPHSAMAVLCEDYKAVEQAALDDFSSMATKPGKPAKVNPLIRLAPELLAPRFSGARLMLPDADECDLRPSALRRTHNAYFCFWKSEQPDFAAADQAKRIAACFGGEVTKSEFSTDLIVVTPAKVRFTLASQHAYDHYGVRLLVDGPQF
jgi:hypothetical protein